jgi:protein-tyrosine phosphatase
MADVVLRRMAATIHLGDGTMLADHLAVSSAGTTGWHRGEGMDPRARRALERRGYADHGHRARQFETGWFATTDLVVCLDRGHRESLLRLDRGSAGVPVDRLVVLLRSYEPDAADSTGETADVPDPYYGSDADFEHCLALIERACRGLADQLADQVVGRAPI